MTTLLINLQANRAGWDADKPMRVEKCTGCGTCYPDRDLERANLVDGVCSSKRGVILGYVGWYGSWRQYCYHPNERVGTVLSVGCLTDIQHFIGQLAAMRRERKKEAHHD